MISPLKKYCLVLIALLYSFSMAAQAPPICDYKWIPWKPAFTVDCPAKEYELEYEDHFDDEILNTTYWSVYNENEAAPLDRALVQSNGNGTYFEGAVYDEDNVVIEDGLLKLEARKGIKIYTGIWGETMERLPDLIGIEGTPFALAFKYSSGRILPEENRQPKYHLKMEVAMKLPNSRGLWPAFWSFHPPSEVDFLEIFDTKKDDFFQTGLIGWDENGDNANCEKQNDLPISQFHLYTAEVTPWVVKLSLNGQLVVAFYRYYTTSGLPVGHTCGQEYPAGPYFENMAFPKDTSKLGPILNLAVGRTLADEDKAKDGTLKIDFVKVYTKNECPQSLGDLTISADTEINEDGIYNNITITDGATLTIKNAEIRMAKNGTIKVQNSSTLKLENARIDKICGNWNGIEVSHSIGAPAQVIVKNSTILWAQTGIRMGSLSPIANVVLPVLTMSNNSKIARCQTGIHFLPGQTSSTINQTTFSNNRKGILLTQSTGLIINQSRFRNVVEGIQALDSQLQLVEGNSFKDGVRGIVSEGTVPIMSGLIIGEDDTEPNVFENLEEGILFTGNSTPTASQIVNCKFENISKDPIYFLGENSYNVQNCSFSNSKYGVYSYSPGNQWFNFIQCNTFEDDQNNNANVIFFGNNERNQFLENFFDDTQGSSNFNFVSAVMASNIASPLNPAGNCFSPSGNDFFFYDFPGTNAPNFTYHYFDENGNPECQEPMANPEFFDRQSSDSEPNHCFGNIGPFGLIGPPTGGGINAIPQYPIEISQPICLSCIRGAIETAKNNYQQAGGQNLATTFMESRIVNAEILALRQQLVQWINYGLYVGIAIKDWTFAESILDPLAGYEWKKYSFGLKVLQKDFEQAQIILDNLPETDPDVVQFKQVQQLNLKRLDPTQEDKYFTEQEMEELSDIATGIQPSSGYAASLYHWLSGEDVDKFHLDDLNQQEARNQNKWTSSAQNLIRIYPNPAQEQLIIEIQKKDLPAQLEIHNFTGKLAISRQISTEKNSININNLNSGLYLLTIYTNRHAPLHQEKIIVR